MITINLMTCRCGCGGSIDVFSGWKYGHWNVGIKRTKEVCKRMGLAGRGRVTSEKTKKLQSIAKIGKRLQQSSYDKMSRTRIERGTFAKANNPMWNPDRKGVYLRGLMYRCQRHMLGRIMKRLGTKKSSHTDEELGYSTDDLRRHLESLFVDGMSWKNYGRGRKHWNIDHIKEVHTFSLSSNVREINALSNLRPLWWEDNIARNRKL